MANIIYRFQTLWRRLFSVGYRYPAMDITLEGRRHLHLVGSIHMGTRNMKPLPAVLHERLQEADALIVEADITAGASPFSESDLCPPLALRLSEEQLQKLQRHCEELNIDLSRVDTLPAWQIALMLQAQQAQRLGLRADCGIDYQLLQAAHDQQRKVIELEGPEAQLTMLKSLPDNGLPLLEDTLQHWQTNARLLQTMVSWWLEAPPGSIGKLALPSTFSNSLNDMLMHQRNQQWCQFLRQLPPGRYVVAVGALHLYGEGNLRGLLANG
ncbi:TraB/GumN family protein [Erwinia sorbitola]|uniref:Conjugal transfer protein TraB n=1 Tax=Erwinia sorbitola TaxID=2681984 RepID=A0A6I6EJ69_9GAMM|nr:TraB/GumN family protein [Erwinia sorbitola]MTD27050.1 conjugal transfer protein TraB [Erwinia sorbitola]QGU88608.1 conjugal transfer protein TraB [Erwinia sorbitola]